MSCLVFHCIGGLSCDAAYAHGCICAVSTIPLHANVALLTIALSPAILNDVSVARETHHQHPYRKKRMLTKRSTVQESG